jgi:putative acetyltransferase
MNWHVRLAETSDRRAILEVVAAAFRRNDRNGQAEVGIVERTWKLGAAAEALEFIVVNHSVVLGHVLAARGRLGNSQALGVAPLSVLPSSQRQGIGSALMTELLRRSELAGWPLVLLLGDPRYYSRFGFEAAGRLGISYPPVGPDDPHFMARRLSSFADHLRGEFSYCWEASGFS